MSSGNPDFSTLFELLPIGAYRSHPGGVQVRANRAMVELFGFKSEAEMLATASARAEGWYVQPGRRAEFREQLMAQGSLRDFVSEMRRPNGETFWISENAHVVRDAQGNVLYHEGTIEDITARVLAERAAAGASELLLERTDALQLTLDNAGRGIIRVDAGGVVVLYNRRFLELLELPESLLAARPTLAQVIQFQQERGDFGDQMEPIELDPRSGEEVRALDVTVPPAGGSYLRRTRGGLVIEVAIETLPAGGMVRTYSDVTAHYTAQKELAEKTRILEITLDSMSQGIATIDASGRTVTSNRRHQELLNLPPELMATRPTMEQLVRFQIERGDFGENFQFVDAVARGYVAVGDKVPAIQGPETYLRKTRDGKTLEVRTRPLPEGGVVRTFTDMTEYVRTQEALIAAKEAAEAGERAKAEFLANMSHEIRTPMNAVIGMSDLLLDTPLSATQREFAETIRTSGDSLLVLINDILDFSKIESGSLTLEHVPVNLAECVESALDITSGPAVAKGLDLLYWIEDEVPRAIYGDLTRLRQVFINLINNAVKFTQHGEVVVTLSRRPAPPGAAPDAAALLHGSVRDTGIGIPADRKGRLFQVFSQVDASTTRQYGGTGLGLAICRRLIELMGGRIWVESVVGEGSTFQFEIPMQMVPSGPAAWVNKRAAALAGRRVLLVDDNATNRHILTLQTSRWGMVPRAASSGPQALGWLDAGEIFDAAILDVQMPGMDGYMLAAELRKRLSAAQLPVLVLTSLGDDGGKLAGLGVAQTLTKPTKAQVLFEAVSGLFDRPIAAPPAAPPPAESPATTKAPRLAQELPLRVLLAEDNEVNQRVASLILSGLGYDIRVAGNGQQALDAVAAAAQGSEPFDVVLMDVQMPELDGLEATRRLCKDVPVARRPWIIAMTANAMEGDREDCLAAGMDDYLSKPIRAAAIIDALRRAAAGLAARR